MSRSFSVGGEEDAIAMMKGSCTAGNFARRREICGRQGKRERRDGRRYRAEYFLAAISHDKALSFVLGRTSTTYPTTVRIASQAPSRRNQDNTTAPTSCHHPLHLFAGNNGCWIPSFWAPALTSLVTTQARGVIGVAYVCGCLAGGGLSTTLRRVLTRDVLG